VRPQASLAGRPPRGNEQSGQATFAHEHPIDASAAPHGVQAWREAWAVCDVAVTGQGPPALWQGLQEQRRVALFEAAVARSPLMRRVFAGRDPRQLPLQQLPVQRKSELMRHFDDWVADPRLHLAELRRFAASATRIGHPHLGQYTVWQSSGSSGEPTLFVQDGAAMAVYDALETLRRPWLQPWRRWLDPAALAERTAFVGATTGHFASTVNVERLRLRQPWRASNLRGFSFLQPIDELVQALNAFRPTVLATYPTVALALAEQAEAGRLRVPLAEVWTGGEALSPAMRRVIVERFDCALAHSYGASEFLALAGECAQHALHLNADWVILEPVDARGRAVAPGLAGHTTLLTNLANHVQPLLRCDLGDRVALSPQRCACGSPLPVIEVQGRVDDALLLRDAGGRAVRLVPLALTTVLEEHAQVYAFQIEQRSERELLLRLPQGDRAGAAARRRACAALRSFLAQQGLGNVAVEAHSGAPVRRGRSGKAPRVSAGRCQSCERI